MNVDHPSLDPHTTRLYIDEVEQQEARVATAPTPYRWERYSMTKGYDQDYPPYGKESDSVDVHVRLTQQSAATTLAAKR
jgi:hypothetical protein